jgi:FKBP-type peptidyl-prolyl cis-trans isomerase FkpA
MKLSTPLIAVFVAALSLSACGGGSDATTGTAVTSPATLTVSDSVIGTGATAVSGATATVTYTGWLYNANASDYKGTQFDTGPLTFVVGAGTLIAGFEQGVVGMKVGGTRTLLIPSSLGYGATGSGSTIPANSGLVFTITLTAIK